MADTVLVVDMLRGFLEEGYPLYIGEEARSIIPNIQGLLEKEIARGSKVFFVCDNHDPDDLEFKMFPPHCIAGTTEAEVIAELVKYPGEIIPKKRYSALFNTNLDEILKKIKPGKLIVCGVLTDICVMHTIADARNRDYTVEAPVDCVAALDEKTQQFALDHIEKVLGARLTRFKEV
ncbi:MAG: cysteine hydrolase [Dehalococcoidales bacterium]|nr:cysteine hydrolase [Dehalococcoidales bacterium]